METQEYIQSGILELYVFGLLSETENLEVKKMADEHESVQSEILSIEKAVINLSYVVSPHLSSANYEKIRQKLIEKYSEREVVQLEPKRGIAPYIGWAAAVLLMFGMGIQYYKYNQANEELNKVSVQSTRFQELLANLEKTNNQNATALNVLRDKGNKVVPLAGQEVAPQAYATVYMNTGKKEVYVDISGLPKAPEGKVYQMWALQFNPLTPNSIGVLSDAGNTSGVFKVDNFDGVQGFGITLEPAGGSKSPTLDQLYTLGQI
ncbi:anti-sigma factor [Flavobacterium akiainvivens]|uniref:Anti-sigma factor n=1 Tax=Flavobacterium akiainvivens TaxID=1202724 RepID=A0A0M8MFT1_9FLAO|nr:anti-sigma factor [Flavobacterium akiainvivens]KOS04867.1 anti-sigma factor [Flavobacterium akiainvivens]SFQ42970.1 Anti-sigma-K factor rskA [Flavobacterium akiainvivens]